MEGFCVGEVVFCEIVLLGYLWESSFDILMWCVWWVRGRKIEKSYFGRDVKDSLREYF